MATTWAILSLAFLVSCFSVYSSARPYITEIQTKRRKIKDQREEAVVRTDEDKYVENSEKWNQKTGYPEIVVMASYEGQSHINQFIADVVESAGVDDYAQALCFNLQREGVIDFAWHEVRDSSPDQIKVHNRSGRLDQRDAEDAERYLRSVVSGRRELEAVLHRYDPSLTLDDLMKNSEPSYHELLEKEMSKYADKSEEISKRNGWDANDQVVAEMADAGGGPLSRETVKRMEDPRSLPGKSQGLEDSRYPLGSYTRDGKLRLSAYIKYGRKVKSDEGGGRRWRIGGSNSQSKGNVK
ncbi:hypothetical protein [Nocardiopsis coralliicola]